ncbi:hypothetical protein Tco_1380566 [Tanacetum coccineum]
MVRTLILDKKNQTSAPVKAVEQSCVTCGGGHSYQNCPATDGNIYRDNIQEYVSQAAAANFNQGNTGARPPMVANQIRPPGFPPLQNNQNNQVNRYNQGNNYNQNRGNNFNQGPNYQPPSNQPPAYQAPAYHAPVPQAPGVPKNDFEIYVKANDAVIRNVQTQGQTMQNQLTNLTDMLSRFVASNTASTSGSGTLPGNTVTNPKEDLKGITTRSGVTYQGPTIPPTTSSPKVMNRDTEVTKDTMLPTNNGSTEDVQPPVVQVQSRNPISKPVVAPVSAPMPNQRTSIPFPSRRNDERRREKANDQIEKFYEIFRDLSFEISFTDALTYRICLDSKNFNRKTKRNFEPEPPSTLILGKFLKDQSAIIEVYVRIRKELKVVEAKTVKSSIDEPPEVELKDLPPHLEYAFLKGDDKLPVIIAKDLKDEERQLFIMVSKVPQAEPRLKTLRISRVLIQSFLYSQNPYGRGLRNQHFRVKDG